jgi:hypothetical protein
MLANPRREGWEPIALTWWFVWESLSQKTKILEQFGCTAWIGWFKSFALFYFKIKQLNVSSTRSSSFIQHGILNFVSLCEWSNIYVSSRVLVEELTWTRVLLVLYWIAHLNKEKCFENKDHRYLLQWNRCSHFDAYYGVWWALFCAMQVSSG